MMMKNLIFSCPEKGRKRTNRDPCQIESDYELNDFILSQGGEDDCTEKFENNFVENEVPNGVLGGNRVDEEVKVAKDGDKVDRKLCVRSFGGAWD